MRNSVWWVIPRPSGVGGNALIRALLPHPTQSLSAATSSLSSSDLLIPSWASATLPIRSLASRADQWAADSLPSLEPVWRLTDHVQPTSRKPPTGQAGEAPPDGPQDPGEAQLLHKLSLVIRSQGCEAFSPPDPQCSHRGGVRPSNTRPGSLCWEKLFAQAPLLPWTPKLVGKTPAPPTLRLDRHAWTMHPHLHTHPPLSFCWGGGEVCSIHPRAPTGMSPRALNWERAEMKTSEEKTSF